MRSIKPGAVALALVGVLAACDGQSPPAAATDAGTSASDALVSAINSQSGLKPSRRSTVAMPSENIRHIGAEGTRAALSAAKLVPPR